jgi:hypothetical protein
LEQHDKAVHPGYECMYCSKEFSSEQARAQHQDAKHVVLRRSSIVYSSSYQLRDAVPSSLGQSTVAKPANTVPDVLSTRESTPAPSDNHSEKASEGHDDVASDDHSEEASDVYSSSYQLRNPAPSSLWQSTVAKPASVVPNVLSTRESTPAPSDNHSEEASDDHSDVASYDHSEGASDVYSSSSQLRNLVVTKLANAVPNVLSTRESTPALSDEYSEEASDDNGEEVSDGHSEEASDDYDEEASDDRSDVASDDHNEEASDDYDEEASDIYNEEASADQSEISVSQSPKLHVTAPKPVANFTCATCGEHFVTLFALVDHGRRGHTKSCACQICQRAGRPCSCGICKRASTSSAVSVENDEFLVSGEPKEITFSVDSSGAIEPKAVEDLSTEFHDSLIAVESREPMDPVVDDHRDAAENTIVSRHEETSLDRVNGELSSDLTSPRPSSPPGYENDSLDSSTRQIPETDSKEEGATLQPYVVRPECGSVPCDMDMLEQVRFVIPTFARTVLIHIPCLLWLHSTPQKQPLSMLALSHKAQQWMNARISVDLAF